jgi:hypothetical protein
MNKLMLVFTAGVLLLLSSGGRAQTSTLQFSQVLTFAANNITTSPHNIGIVPAGKVWKIEHMAGSRSGYMPNFVFYINGMQSSDLYSTNTTSYFYPNEYPKGPVWLKAGDEIRIIYGSGSYPANYFISVIEFSVVTFLLMKRLLVLFFVLFASVNLLFAQGNTLVFNQVLTFSNNNITVSPYTIGTVPAGKVWKIEYMGSYRYSNHNTFVINSGTSENEYSLFVYESASANPTPHGPVWLKQGDVIKVMTGSISYPATYFISVLEFNVVPL